MKINIKVGSTIREPSATPEQIKYIEILANDTGFSQRVHRQDFISTRLKRTVRFLDEPTVTEASKVIDWFKAIKEEQRG